MQQSISNSSENNSEIKSRVSTSTSLKPLVGYIPNVGTQILVTRKRFGEGSHLILSVLENGTVAEFKYQGKYMKRGYLYDPSGQELIKIVLQKQKPGEGLLFKISISMLYDFNQSFEDIELHTKDGSSFYLTYKFNGISKKLKWGLSKFLSSNWSLIDTENPTTSDGEKEVLATFKPNQISTKKVGELWLQELSFDSQSLVFSLTGLFISLNMQEFNKFFYMV